MLRSKNIKYLHKGYVKKKADLETLIYSIIDSIPDALLITEVQNNIVVFNNTFVQLWQIPTEVIQTYKWELVFNYLDSKIQLTGFFIETIKYLNKNPEEASFKELDLINGSIIECYTLPRWENNKIVGRIWSFRDVSQQKRVERVLQTQKQELVNAHRIASLGSWSYNLSSKEFSHSESFSQLFGGLSVYKDLESLINVVHPDDIDEVKQFFSSLTTTGEKDNNDLRYRIVKDDGREYYVRTVVEVIYTHGEPKLLLGISQDITKQVLLEKSLASATEAAEDFNLAKGIFLANMSHEMRTPLNAILGYTEILLQTPMDKLNKDYLNSIKSSGASLLSLIEDVLYITKVDGQKVKITDDNVNIRGLFQEIYELFKFKFEEKGLSFNMHIEKHVPDFVITDSARLKQILINLISNAHKFTENGFVQVNVEGEKIPDTGRVELIILIEDTGIGIKQKDKKIIFESFHQVEDKDKRNFDGIGLGLYITKKNVELLGGIIEVQSAPDIGSIFSVSLKNLMVPVSIDENSEDQYIDTANIVFEEANILIADDSDFNRRVLKGLLSKFDFNIVEVDNGSDAVLLAKKFYPSIIIMDLKMPKMDGFESLDVIRANSKIKNIPIIAFSSPDDGINKESVLKKGFDDFLSKPVTYSKIVALLSKFLLYELIDNQLDKDDSKLVLANDIEKLFQNEKLLCLLKNNLFDTWEQLSKKRTSKNQKEFARKIEQFGSENDLEFIKNMGGSLLQAQSVYDVDEAKKIMNEIDFLFKKIIRKPGKI